MVGDVVYVGKKMHVVVNDGGTLEQLPYVGFWRQAYIEISSNFKQWHPQELRNYCIGNSLFMRGKY